jgi:hypothetical protein
VQFLVTQKPSHIMQLGTEQNSELFQTTGGCTRQQTGQTTTWIVDLKSLLQRKLGLIMHTYNGCTMATWFHQKGIQKSTLILLRIV